MRYILLMAGKEVSPDGKGYVIPGIMLDKPKQVADFYLPDAGGCYQVVDGLVVASGTLDRKSKEVDATPCDPLRVWPVKPFPDPPTERFYWTRAMHNRSRPVNRKPI